jgi:ribosomal protein S18 acetylase RimI-like enzyme
MLAIRRATPADAESFTGLARRTFHDAYAATAPPDQLAIHLARAFTPARQAAELADPDLVTLLAMVHDDVAGYAQVRLRGGSTPPSVPAGTPIEVARFYLEQAWVGRGVARPLMDATCALGRPQGATHAWLAVWEGNRRAIRFYEKCGFREVGRTPYQFGDRVEDDWVMVRAFSADSAVQPGV